MINFLSLGVLLVLVNPSLQKSSFNSKTYIGAVVEYHPVVDGDNGQVVAETNANHYQKIIKKASTYNIDIIVFPESGITTLPKYGPREEKFNATEFRAFYRDLASYVPNPDESIVPCDIDEKYKKSLRKISCVAREYKMYVVVNHHERADCPEPNCSPDNFLLYNTNVVFDRNGKVIARYRKYNLYNEDGTNITAQPEYSTFSTDFGVTFGQFICADILHEKPATFFANNPNITDIIFSTHWFNDLPFMDAVQHQASWSYSADVNFLASNYNRMQTSSGGSGIYAGKNGPLVMYHSLKAANSLIIAEIPKLKNGKRMDDTKLSKPIVKEWKLPTQEQVTFEKNYLMDLRMYKSEDLYLHESCVKTTICDRGLCCNFQVKIDYDDKLVTDDVDAQHYRYRFLVFNGIPNMANVTLANLELCALVACAGDRLGDCGNVHPLNTKTIYPTNFVSLNITRQPNLSERIFYEPLTLTLKHRLPLDSKEFIYNGNDQNSNKLEMSLIKSQTDLMVFGIWGRRFNSA